MSVVFPSGLFPWRRRNFLVLVLLVVFCLSAGKGVPAERHDYCVIGAGPGGLQLGYYLQQAGRDYMLFERNSVPGKYSHF